MSSKIIVKYPIGIQWRIPESRLQELRNSNRKYLQSTIFKIPNTDVEYFVKIFPNGNPGMPRMAVIHFNLMFNEKKKIKADFTISIDSANFIDKDIFIFDESAGYGGRICETDELFDPKNRYIVNGEMEIKLEGFLMIEMDEPIKSCQLGKSGHQLSIDLWNQESKDFAIVAEEKEITAHKCILSNRSPVFKAIFQHAQENKVAISDFTFDVVETAIKFCYDSSLVENVSFEDQISLLQFFDKYDIQMLKDDLEKHLISEINELNVCRLANASVTTNSPKLRFKCLKFLQDCIKTRAVTDLDILNKDFALDLLKSSMLAISL